MYKLSPVYI